MAVASDSPAALGTRLTGSGPITFLTDDHIPPHTDLLTPRRETRDGYRAGAAAEARSRSATTAATVASCGTR